MSEPVELDTKGLTCPLPVLRARKAMKSLAPGAELTVLATDPGSIEDFRAFCESAGHRLVAQEESDGVFIHRIRKAAE